MLFNSKYLFRDQDSDALSYSKNKIYNKFQLRKIRWVRVLMNLKIRMYSVNLAFCA